MDHFPANDHYEDEVLKNINEQVFPPTVIFRKIDLRKILLLLDKVVFIADVPTEWVTQSL